MNKTMARRSIKDRANRWRKSINGSVDHQFGYEAGAEKQLNIDIEDAVSWLDDVLHDTSINSGMNKKKLLEKFKEFMEEMKI